MEFGDLVTGDHFIRRHDGGGAKEAVKDVIEATPVSIPGGDDASSDSEAFYEGAKNAEVALVLLDKGTGLLQAFPHATKSAEHTAHALKQFTGTDKVKSLRADGAHEIAKAAREQGWPHDTSTPLLYKSSGVAERAVRTVRDGGRCTLEQSGLRPAGWPWAFTQYCALHND